MDIRDGVGMSTNLTHLTPMRHRLNLTIRGNVFVRRVLIEGSEAVAVEVESGGETFRVESDSVVLSEGALKSPHILMLSGVGPRGVGGPAMPGPGDRRLGGRCNRAFWGHLNLGITSWANSFPSRLGIQGVT